MTPDDGGDLAERDTFIGYRVIHGVFRSSFECEDVEPCSIAHVNGGPVIGALTYVRGYTVFARKPDDDRDEAVMFSGTVR